MKIWHYTDVRYLPLIFESKKIKLAKAFFPEGVKAAVWFSTNPVWEETANKMYRGPEVTSYYKGTKETTYILGAGLARIRISRKAAPYTWEDYKRMSGITRGLFEALEDAAREDGANPGEWRLNFEPVPIDKWLAVEVLNWDRQTWEDASSEADE